MAALSDESWRTFGGRKEKLNAGEDDRDAAIYYAREVRQLGIQQSGSRDRQRRFVILRITEESSTIRIRGRFISDSVLHLSLSPPAAASPRHC